MDRRKAGRLLAATVKHEGGRPEKNPTSKVGLLPDGVSWNQSSRWQKVGQLTEQQLDAWADAMARDLVGLGHDTQAAQEAVIDAAFDRLEAATSS